MADHRHKRDTDARRKPRAAVIAGPLALLATASAVTIGVLASSPQAGLVATGASTDLADARVASADLGGAVFGIREPAVTSRSAQRLPGRRLEKAQDSFEARQATLRAVKQAHDELWTTTDLNIWSDPTDGATQLGELGTGKHVLVTGRTTDGRTEVVIDGVSRWVTSGYLSEDKPVAAAAGLSMAPCPDPSVENGLVSDAVYVYRSVCHAFPQITSYGGWDGHGEHASGKALDIMTSDKALGDAIATFLQSHASELNLFDVIWWDRIWTPVRASEGWRSYGNHGSATANHMDHVHVSTN